MVTFNSCIHFSPRGIPAFRLVTSQNGPKIKTAQSQSQNGPSWSKRPKSKRLKFNLASDRCEAININKNVFIILFIPTTYVYLGVSWCYNIVKNTDLRLSHTIFKVGRSGKWAVLTLGRFDCKSFV